MADETEETAGDVTETEPLAQVVPEAVAEAPAEAPTTQDGDAPEQSAPLEAAAAPQVKPSTAATPAVEEEGPRQNRRKVREGVVVSDAMQSTVVVAVVERVRHPRYGKTVQRTKKLYVHDAEDTAKVGDRVRVQETRPLSKLKRWRLTEVVERAR